MIAFLLMLSEKHKTPFRLSQVAFFVTQILSSTPALAHPGYDLDFCGQRSPTVKLTEKQRTTVIEQLTAIYPDFNFKEIEKENDRNEFVFKIRKAVPATKDKDPYFDVCFSYENQLKEKLLKLSDIINIDYILHSSDGKQIIPKIHIKKMSSNIDELVKKVLQKIKSSYPESKITSIIIDLRDNLGGNLGATARLSDFFLHQNKLIVSKKKLGEKKPSVRYISNKLTKDAPQCPIIFYVNKNTASAAEVFIHALKNGGVHVLITGNHSETYGKGTFQNITNIPNPSGSGFIQVRATAGEWTKKPKIKPKFVFAHSSPFFEKIAQKIFEKYNKYKKK